MSSFNDLFNSDDEHIRDAANSLAEIDSQFLNGKLTEAEAKELAADLLDLDRVRELTNDLNRNSEIVKAYETLRMIASTLFSVI